MWKTEERGKGQDGEGGGRRKTGVTSVVSRAEEDSSGHAAWGECMERWWKREGGERGKERHQGEKKKSQ